MGGPVRGRGRPRVGRPAARGKDDAAQAMLTDVTDTEDRLHLAEMKEVQSALHRLDEGTFGDCVDCGEPIPLQRLLLVPAALRCTTCQTAGERAA